MQGSRDQGIKGSSAAALPMAPAPLPRAALIDPATYVPPAVVLLQRPPRVGDRVRLRPPYFDDWERWTLQLTSLFHRGPVAMAQVETSYRQPAGEYPRCTKKYYYPIGDGPHTWEGAVPPFAGDPVGVTAFVPLTRVVVCGDEEIEMRSDEATQRRSDAAIPRSTSERAPRRSDEG
jgi:hypothetical protein